ARRRQSDGAAHGNAGRGHLRRSAALFQGGTRASVRQFRRAPARPEPRHRRAPRAHGARAQVDQRGGNLCRGPRWPRTVPDGAARVAGRVARAHSERGRAGADRQAVRQDPLPRLRLHHGGAAGARARFPDIRATVPHRLRAWRPAGAPAGRRRSSARGAAAGMAPVATRTARRAPGSRAMKRTGPRPSNYITPEGHKALTEELRYLWQEERPRVTQHVADAAALGDRSENAEYIYGKKRLREIDRRVRFLRKRLEVLKVVDQMPAN